MNLVWILFVFWGDYRGGVTSAEFADEASCHYAQTQMPVPRSGIQIETVCVPKQIARK